MACPFVSVFVCGSGTRTGATARRRLSEKL
jgi:hypothetical protein